MDSKRIVIVNGFSTSMFRNPNFLVVAFRRITPEEVQQQLAENREVISYVRHQGTVDVLKRIIPQINVNAGVYEYAEGDVIIMAVLATPARGVEVANPDIILYQIIPHRLE